ncbi:MAG: dihydropteroate synthase, partial [Dehalococcoidia bacterium]
MEIVGELINSSRKPISDAIEAQDTDTIQRIARDQWESGIDFIDVNAGTFPNEEADYLKWLVTVIQEVVEGPCSLDSPNPRAIEAA